MEGMEETLDFYNNQAENYFDETRNLILSTEISRFVKLCPKNSRVLDIGPGSGRDLKEFSKAGLYAIGIDVSENMAHVASEYSNCEVFVSNVDNLPFKNNEFSGIWAKASLHHIPSSHIKKSMKEINRVQKKGGVFYSSVKIGQGEKLVDINNYKRFYSFYSLEGYGKLLEGSGYRIFDIYVSKSINPKRPDDFINVFARKD